MGNLRVVAFPSAPIVCLPHEGLPLDGILSYAAGREQLGEDFYHLDPRTDYVPIDLPLEKRGAGERWFWAASFALWGDEAAEGTDHWNKRFDDQRAETFADFGGRKAQVVTSQGRFRSYHMPVPTFSVGRMEWFAVGDGEEVRRLLAGVTHVGKKTSQGFGRIREWQVEEAAEDWSVWKDGRLTRAVPTGSPELAGATLYDLRLCGFRPPYWLPQHQTACAVQARREAQFDRTRPLCYNKI
jgi:CRISPR type IV-associated protein Csf3